MNFGEKPFGLRDVKLGSWELDSSGEPKVIVDLPASQKLVFKERIKGGELMGDDVVASVVAIADAVEWELESGGISLAAYALMTGRTVDATGSTPNQMRTMAGRAGDVFPWFRIYGLAVGEGSDGIHCKISKCKLTGSIEGEFADGSFYVQKCAGIGVGDSDNNNLTHEFAQHETTTALPVVT